jgi:hypothetical protein
LLPEFVITLRVHEVKIAISEGKIQSYPMQPKTA